MEMNIEDNDFNAEQKELLGLIETVQNFPNKSSLLPPKYYLQTLEQLVQSLIFHLAVFEDQEFFIKNNIFYAKLDSLKFFLDDTDFLLNDHITYINLFYTVKNILERTSGKQQKEDNDQLQDDCSDKENNQNQSQNLSENIQTMDFQFPNSHTQFQHIQRKNPIVTIKKQRKNKQNVDYQHQQYQEDQQGVAKKPFKTVTQKFYQYYSSQNQESQDNQYLKEDEEDQLSDYYNSVQESVLEDKVVKKNNYKKHQIYIILCNSEGGIINCEKGIERMFNLKKNQIINNSIFKLMTEKSRQAVKDYMELKNGCENEPIVFKFEVEQTTRDKKMVLKRYSARAYKVQLVFDKIRHDEVDWNREIELYDQVQNIQGENSLYKDIVVMEIRNSH